MGAKETVVVHKARQRRVSSRSSGPPPIPAAIPVNLVTPLTAQFASRIVPAQASAIVWEIRCEGKLVRRKEGIGETYRLAVPDFFAGRELSVTPYLPNGRKGLEYRLRVEMPRPGAFPSPNEAVVPELRRDASGKWWATVARSPEYFVGEEVRYSKRRGLANARDPLGPYYDRTAAAADHGVWANLIYPTAKAESDASFVALNTYDSAAFTFGFLQFAAHTPEDNFVLLLRDLIGRPEAPFYFPDLSLRAGHIKHSSGRLLESSTSTTTLMNYLNPSASAIDRLSEVSASARMIYWMRTEPQACDLQVELAVRKVRRYLRAKAEDLHGHTIAVCALVFDIAHQGRAGTNGYPRLVRPALSSQKPVEALLRIGASSYPERIRSLRESLVQLEHEAPWPLLRYSKTTNEFVTVR
jgi:hypothetical protein